MVHIKKKKKAKKAEGDGERLEGTTTNTYLSRVWILIQTN